MDGVVIPVSPQKLWDFSYLTATVPQDEVFLVRAISVVPFKSLSLFVRVHSNRIQSTNENIKVLVGNVFPDAGDPQLFEPAGNPILAATVDGGLSNNVVTVSGTRPPGPWVWVKVQGNQNPTAPTIVAASLSIGLLGRVN